MTTPHYKPGGDSKARRRRKRAQEAIWGEFVDHWFMIAKFRDCDYVQISVAPHGVIAMGYFDRTHFFRQLHEYGDQSIKTFQASTTLAGARGDTLLSVRLQRPGYRQDGSRDLGVRETPEDEASKEGPGPGSQVSAALRVGERHQEVRAFAEGFRFDRRQT
jgi:hypothetical protein